MEPGFASQERDQPRAPAQAYEAQGNPAQSYQGAGFSESGFLGAGQRPSFAEQTYPEASLPEAGFAATDFPDAGVPDASFRDAGYPDPTANAGYARANLQDAKFPDASFQDASYPDEDEAEAGFSAQEPNDASFDEHEPLHLETLSDDCSEPDYDPDAGQAVHDYVAQAQHEGAPGAIPAHQALQAFDAVYDQPPQIKLGATAHSRQSAQSFYEGEQSDADFLDEDQFVQDDDSPPPPPRKLGLRSRSMFMVGSALLGAVALGGALAFAYKQSGGAMSGEPPLVQADSRPVKEAPQQPGGKEFPHKNKLIYERLQNGDQPEAERVVPRQEELAMPAMPSADPSAQTSAGPAPQPPPATVDDPNADGGPRRVKTLVVRPDGSVMPPPTPPAAPQQVAEAAPQAAPPQQAAAAPQAAPPAPAPQATPVAADPQPVAAIPAAAPKPKPAPAPEAAPKPKPAPAPEAASSSKYVVQVGSKQNQTEALATFADLQQKYPTLLSSYRPMVQKANLGSKGVWYRLRIGPISDKSAATKLCGQLKSQGHPDCLVMAAQ